jgi:multiple sugar transport system substrate-binding protein
VRAMEALRAGATPAAGQTRRAALLRGAALGGGLAAAGAAACAPAGPVGTGPQYGGEVAQLRVQGGIGNNPGVGDHWDEALAEFKAKFPRVEATWEPNPPTTDSGDWVVKLVAAMAGGAAPDVYGAWGDLYAKFAGAGGVENVEQYVRRIKASEVQDFAKWQWDAFTAVVPGVRVGLPRYINIIVLYYNKDLFDQAGAKYPDAAWTMDNYREALVRLSRDTMGSGKRDQWGGKLSYNAWDRLNRYVQSWGGHLVEPKDRNRCLLGTPEAQGAFQWLSDRIWKENSMAQFGQLKDAVNDTGNYIGFYQRKLATVEEGISGIGRNFANNIERAGGFNWSIAHVPKGPAGRVTLGTTDGWAMWTGSKGKNAAWELMWYMASPTFQRIQAQYQSQLPVRLSVQEEYKRILRQQWPTLEKVDLDVALEAQKLGYPRDNENFADQQKAAELIDPALRQVLVDGTAPVSLLQDVCRQVDATQPAPR